MIKTMKGYLVADDVKELSKFRGFEYIDDDLVMVRIDDNWRLFVYDDEEDNWFSLDEYIFSCREDLMDFVRDSFYVQPDLQRTRPDMRRMRGYATEEIEDETEYTKKDLEFIISDIVEFEKSQGRQPAAWVKDEDIWERAKEAASKSDPDNYWALVTYLYKKMGGRIGSKD